MERPYHAKLQAFTNIRAADGWQCTRAPGVPAVPIPQEYLDKLNMKGVSKKRGRQCKKAEAEEQKACPRFVHGYDTSALRDLGHLQHGLDAENPAFQNATGTPKAVGLGDGNQGWVAPPRNSPAYPPANSLVASSTSSNIESAFSQQDMTATCVNPILAPSDPQNGFSPYEFANNTIDPLSTSLSPDYVLPQNDTHMNGGDQYLENYGTSNMSVGGLPFTLPQPYPFQGAIIDSNTGMSGMPASAAEEVDPGHHSDLSHNCTCGPECGCVACPLHPYNEATRQHLLTGASHLALQAYLNGNHEWNHPDANQRRIVSEPNTGPGENIFPEPNNDPEPTFNTKDYHMFIGHFSRAEIEANHPQALQAFDYGMYDQTFTNP